MNSTLRRTAALAVCFLLASCANSPAPATGPQKPRPAELLVLCQEPPLAPTSGDVDPVAKALKEMYDLYAICAGKTAERIKWDESEALR